MIRRRETSLDVSAPERLMTHVAGALALLTEFHREEVIVRRRFLALLEHFQYRGRTVFASMRSSLL
jgi:hypothetical protein